MHVRRRREPVDVDHVVFPLDPARRRVLVAMRMPLAVLGVRRAVFVFVMVVPAVRRVPGAVLRVVRMPLGRRARGRVVSVAATMVGVLVAGVVARVLAVR